MFLRSFAKERYVLCILFRSLQKNMAFSAFFYNLCKRMLRSLHSFTFFVKEHNVLCVLLGFISCQKHERLVHCVHFHSLKMNVSFTAFISIH